MVLESVKFSGSRVVFQIWTIQGVVIFLAFYIFRDIIAICANIKPIGDWPQ